MKKITVLVVIATLLAKLFGFFREIALSYFFGTDAIVDAYLISITIPDLVFSFIGSAIIVGFIPIYLNKTNPIDKVNFTKKIVGLLSIFSIFTIGTIYIFAEYIIIILAPGFSGHIFEITIVYTRVTVLSIFFTTYVFVMKGYLNSNNKFILATLYTVPTNIIIILVIFFSSRYNIDILHWGYLVATILQFSLFLPIIYKSNLGPKFVNFFQDKDMRKFLYLSIPIILSVAVSDLNSIVDKSFSSLISVGGVASLNYASRLNQFIQGIFIVSILTVMYPKFVNASKEQDFKYLVKTVELSIIAILVILVPVFFGVFFYSFDIVKLLFFRGQFTESDIIITSSVLFNYNIGIIFIGLSHVYTRIFYAKEMNRIPLLYALIAVIVNILLNFIFYRYTELGLSGISLATSIGISTGVMFMFAASFKKNMNVVSLKLIITSFKIFVSSFLALYFVRIVLYDLLILWNSNVGFVLVIFASGILYLFLLYLLDIAGIKKIINKHIKFVFKII